MKKKLLLLNIPLFATATAFLPISCSLDKEEDKDEHFENLKSASWDKEVQIQVKTPWSTVDIDTYSDNIEREFNRLKNNDQFLKSKPDINVIVNKETSDDKILVQNVEAKKFDFAISSISSVNNAKKSLISPKLQTLTNAFKFDKTLTYYKDGNENGDELKKIAEAQNTLFHETLHKNLENDDSKWTGSIYRKFYDFSTKVNFYRGMIWIAGADEEVNAIKDAWRDKDWAGFKSFGILHGNKKSGGKFILQEKLLKKHFGKNAFTTLAEEITNFPNNFREAGSKTMIETITEYKIAFDYEGSFAWTKNQDRDSNILTYYDAQNMQVLVVTEPLKYDIGYYRNDFDLLQANLLTKAIINLTEKSTSEDIYGPTIGYNGYEKINDIYEDVERPYREVTSA
ncbi:ABC transporter thiamine pyrophosphate-binding lipoprotein p37/Cypl [Candidatus Mycoplasma mahonii]|uniref:ABC transporter thiamine pyrophosphate-binding lipoprotein p37/Cypl n=1 Tax=Candidatus Mycoplasma mahonii TaxID=3004105 RepID=UPI0026ED3FB6|nr:hypothetical protein [Candidatus Mycoplasma mahonii]WKX02667.1 hypothetical protein O3I44_01140 [Candidatus Mycoplasma mahonii]